MFIVTVTFEVLPEKAEDFHAAVLAQARTSLLKEQACHRFDVCVDPKRPERIFLYEVYDDEAAFQAHLDTDHFKTFTPTVEPWVQEKTVTCWSLMTGDV